MASKTFTLDGIGEITVYKRPGTKRLNLRIVSNKVRVTQPTWLPYNSGLQFAISNSSWITTQQSNNTELKLRDGLEIGKSYQLTFEPAATLRTRLLSSEIKIFIPPHLSINSPEVQIAAKSAIKRALKKDSETNLPRRVAALAERYDYSFTTVHCKSMRSRWGSCNSRREITLNSYLMMLPWELIDYVLLHELTHTKHLHHGKSFWTAMGEFMPDYKERRKALKEIQKSVSPLQ